MLTKLLTGAKTFAAGVNWPLLFYKFLAVGAMALMFGIICYREGKHDCQADVAKEKITILETEIIKERREVKEAIKKHTKQVDDRLEVITKTSQTLAILDSKLEKLKGGLDAAINSRPANDACAPSDAELQYYTELAKQAN